MLEQYRTVYEGGEGEITEKKSRFIATVHPVESEEEALAFLEEMKKKYWDARHNCYVYSIGMNREFTRCSDDGEPSGTAGRPMLDVILGEDIYNVAVVVTRYFGGILLGTGGLVRAYSEATIKALDKAKIVNKKKGYQVKIVTTYDQIEQFNYYVNKNNLKVVNTEYLENIEIMIEMTEEHLKKITNSNSKNPLKIIKYDILKEKYIDI